MTHHLEDTPLIPLDELSANAFLHQALAIVRANPALLKELVEQAFDLELPNAPVVARLLTDAATERA